ncbi:hypothetical protein ACFL1B_00535 [Nanoarchaeota archaeon]
MSDEVAVEELEALLSDEEGITIHPAESWDEVPEIDFALFNVEEQSFCEIAIGYLRGYLTSFYIEDRFGDDHSARSRWLYELEKRKPGAKDKIKARNALRGGMSNNVKAALEALKITYEGPDGFNQLADRTIDLAEKLSDSAYDQRRDYIYETKKSVHSILMFLAENSPTPSD